MKFIRIVSRLRHVGVTRRYVGELNRDDAARMLSNLPNGTFLIRVSNVGIRRGEHALSIRSDFSHFELFLCFPLYAVDIGLLQCDEVDAVAQRVERWTCDQQVVGSNLAWG